jgi:CO/xanthine dehydrogenase Mo-binding subunit
MAPSRRKFLKGLGWSLAGLTVVAGGAFAFAPRPVLPYRGAPTGQDAAAWLSLRPDGHIELLMPRAEMGQGIAIAFRQIVAEETGFPLDRIVALPPRTDRLPPARATVGSDSVKDFGPLLARAAAVLGEQLSAAGVVEGARPPGGWGALTTRPSLIDAGRIEAVRPRAFAAGRRVAGTPAATDDIRAILTGSEPLYADDIRRPGMVFARRLNAPRLGAVLAGVDDGAARGLPGYLGLHVFGAESFIAAETRGALARAHAALSQDWSGGTLTQAAIDWAIDIDRVRAAGDLNHVVRGDSLADNQPFDIDLRLDVPMAAHATMEPRTAVAEFTADGRLDIWTGSQDVGFVRASLADALAIEAERITVHGCRLGGGFGLRTICTVEREAALMARQLGRAVKVQWSRADEFQEAFHRPPSSHRIRARLAADGTLADWHHAFASGHVIFTSAAMGPGLQFATSFVGDPGVRRGAEPPYAAARMRVEFADIRLPVLTGPWRGLGAAPNAWAIETAVDALARAKGLDPLALRRRLIAPQWPRLARALDRVAVLAGWTELRSTRERGYGLACGIYKDMAYAAVIAEVERDGSGFSVRRLWCAHDCGVMINPDQVRAQVEGNLVWSLGMAMGEQLTVMGGHVGPASLDLYGLPRLSSVPDMMIELVEGGEAASGAGETAIVAGTAAITNAVAAMTGRTVTRLPLAGFAA